MVKVLVAYSDLRSYIVSLFWKKNGFNICCIVSQQNPVKEKTMKIAKINKSGSINAKAISCLTLQIAELSLFATGDNLRFQWNQKCKVIPRNTVESITLSTSLFKRKEQQIPNILFLAFNAKWLTLNPFFYTVFWYEGQRCHRNYQEKW